MESTLGPTVSEFYMSSIENKIIKTILTRPKMYVGYVDNIFTSTHSNDEIDKLKQTLENCPTKLFYQTQY